MSEPDMPNPPPEAPEIPNLTAAAEVFKAALAAGSDPQEAANKAGLVFMPRIAKAIEERLLGVTPVAPVPQRTDEQRAWTWCRANRATIRFAAGTSSPEFRVAEGDVFVVLNERSYHPISELMRFSWAKITPEMERLADPVVGRGPDLAAAVNDLQEKGRERYEALAEIMKVRSVPPTIEEAVREIQGRRFDALRVAFMPYLTVVNKAPEMCCTPLTMDSHAEGF